MEFERERILNGQSVCILAFAEEWAEQECKKLRESGDGLAHWAYSRKLEGMLAELRHAISSNVLKVYDFGRERDYRQSDKAKVEKGHIHVLPRSANAWLEREGFASLALCNDDVCETSNAAAGNSASSPATVTQMGPATEAPPAPASEPASPDYSMLATRDQLIAAFGAFTGMDATWFDNLRDVPALRAARKVSGQGGRGHITEPWFCPFEVMQWLANPRRKKGRPLRDGKAWELLEKHFAKVYSVNSVGDPREV